MKPRERVLQTLLHSEPDCVPFDLGSTLVSGIHTTAYRNLLSFLKLPQNNHHIQDEIQQLAQMDKDVLQHLHVDTRGVFLQNPKGWTAQYHEDKHYRFFKDIWRITWRMPREGGYYYDLWKSPLRGAQSADLATYPWPDPVDAGRIEGLEEKAKNLWEVGEYPVILGSTGMAPGLLQTSEWLLGFEECYARLAGDTIFMDTLLDILAEKELAFWKFFLPRLGKYFDIVVFADDFAGQQGLLLSKNMFRYYFKPRYGQIFSLIKKKAPHISIFFHSCGAIYELIPELVEMGIDILKAVQESAEGMDPKKLKKEFGDCLTFWGGIDTQWVLPFGNICDVKDEVKRRIDELAPGGGYIFGTVHNIQADVPPQNIMALWESFQEIKAYCKA